ncbi:MAG: GNAT family N-acetyltransferase [Chloroflexota bacterium]
MSPLPDIAHWWAIEAMIASYNHVYKVVYGTTYETLDAVAVSNYGSAPIASFQLEFLALDDDPARVHAAVQDYKTDGEKYVLDVFHESPAALRMKAQYSDLGYAFVRTGPILGIELPVQARGDISFVKRIEMKEQLEVANQSLSREGETIPAETLGDPYIRNYYAEADGQAVGWAQLVTIYPGAGYVNQLFTLSGYRNRRIGSALIERLHTECDQLGLGHVVLVSSEMAMGLYRRLGYRLLAFFTAFRPREAGG